MDNLYKKASKTFIVNILGLVMAFLFQLILGRSLKPDLYGQFTMFTIYINIFTIVTVLGMDRNLIKEIARVKKDKGIGYIKFSLKISLLLFTLTSVFTVLFWSHLQIAGKFMALFIITLLIKSFALIIDGYFQGIGKIVRATMINTLLNNILKIILFLIFIRVINDSAFASILSFTVSETLCLILRIGLLDKKLNILTKNHDIFSNEEKQIFVKSSFTFALISGIAILLQNLDKVMISSLLGPNSVGIYKVSQNYVALIGVFVAPFMAFWPTISKLYNDKKISEIEKEMNKITRLIAALAIPMFCMFYFLNSRILLIFGTEYTTSESCSVLIILSLGALFDAVAGPIGSILTMTRYEKYALFNNVIAVVLSVILNLIFINKYGLIGAALGTSISTIVSNLLSIIQVKILLNIFPYDYNNLKQITLSFLINLVICKALIKLLAVTNVFIYVILFGIIIYFCNALVILLIYRKDIINRS